MAHVTVTELAATLEQLQAQMAEISRQMEVLEKRDADEHGDDGAAGVAAGVGAGAAAGVAAGVAAQPTVTPPVGSEPAAAAITEEEVLAIAAAIGAYLGVRAHIRQIRLVGTSAWAQQGRVSIQASHMLQG